MTEVTEKTCKSCGLSKSFCDFGKKKGGKFGLNSICKSCKNQKNKEYRKQNKEKTSKYWKERYEKNIDFERARCRAYYEKNSEQVKAQKRDYKKNNRDVINAYIKSRSETDFMFYLKRKVRQFIYQSFKRRSFRKCDKSLEILGCSLETFRNHIESKFKPGMTWKNYGLHGWHIDHIIPLSTAQSPEDVIKLCCYRNLQPLWAEENLKKSNKLLI